MKKTKIIILGIILAFAVFSFSKAPKGYKAQVSEAVAITTHTEGEEIYKLNLQSSKTTWVGTKPTGKHEGFFKMTDGTVKVKDGKLVGGEYTIDINSLTITDQGMSEEIKGKLAGHLLSPDFFQANRFPTAKFEISKVEEYNPSTTDEHLPDSQLKGLTHFISGNFEMNGITKNIRFPAKIQISKTRMTAIAKFDIDRTDWKMTYGADKSLGDKFIRPTVHVGFEIAASK